MKGLQNFTAEYLEQSRKTSSDAVARFLDDFRRLLAAFKSRCRVEGDNR